MERPRERSAGRPGSGHRSPRPRRSRSPRRPLSPPRGHLTRGYHMSAGHRGYRGRSPPPPRRGHYPPPPHTYRSRSPPHPYRPRSPPAHHRPRYRLLPPPRRTPSPRGHLERRRSPPEPWRGPPDPEDLRYRLSRPSGADVLRVNPDWSPVSLDDEAALEESLQITVGNDFYDRRSCEGTRLSGSLDNVSDDSREDFPDECILPRDRSLASRLSLSDDEHRHSPFDVREDLAYRRFDSSRLPYPQRIPNRDDRLEGSYSPSYKEDNHNISRNIISHSFGLETLEHDRRRPYRENYTVREQEEDSTILKTSILNNQIRQQPDPDRPFQHEGFLNSSGCDKGRSSLMNPLQGSFNPFSSSVEQFLESFIKTETAYKTLEEEQYEQSLLELLAQNLLSDEGKPCKFLDKRATHQLKQEESGTFSGFRHPIRDGHGLATNLSTMVDVSGVQDKRMFPTVEDEEAFLYGNADNLWHVSQSQKEQVNDSMENMIDSASQAKTIEEAEKQNLTEEEQENLQKIHDLLKTIGLEIGDAEIGKLSLRTQERLYGKNLPSREHRTSESQRREAARMRNRSDTRSPETSHHCSRSPTWSVKHSKDRSSYAKSEFSMKDEDGGQQPPSPVPGQQPPSPVPGQQPPSPVPGQQLPSPVPGQQPPSPAPGQQTSISIPEQHPTYSYPALPNAGMPPLDPAGHYQLINYNQYSATQMLQAPVDITSPSSTMLSPAVVPNSPVLAPGFVPNINIPPPAFFQQSHVPNYTQYPIAPVPPNFVPSAQTPYVYNSYGHFMPVPGWSVCPVPPVPAPSTDLHIHMQQQIGANRSNLRVIETISDDTVTNTVENKKQDSSLVYINTTDTLPSPKPDDNNRVSQKLKVLRDLEKLKSERTVREKKLEFLKKKLEIVGKRHGEILEIKSQQNDCHVNPLLTQTKRIEDQLVALCKEAEEADQKESSLEKVAKILGLDISNQKKPPAETKNLSTEEKPEEVDDLEKSTLPIEVKSQTQVGNATSS